MERYAFALGTTGLVGLLKFLWPDLGRAGPDLFFNIAVSASALVGGFGPGLLACAASTLVVAYFAPPSDTLAVAPAELPEVLGFFVEGVFAALLAAGFRGALAHTVEHVGQLEAIERQWSEFAAIVNHELKSPLTALSGHLQLAVRYAGRDPERLGRALERSREQVVRLVRLIDDLLALKPGKIPRFAIERELLDLGELTRAAAERALAAHRGRAIAVGLPGERVEVLADRVRVGQILDNILRNALLYGPPDAPVDVRVERRANDAPGWGRVNIRDHGSPIASGERDRIFERFARGRAGERTAGSGLGLSVSRELAMRMGGTLWLEAAPDGNTFCLELPLAAGSESGRPEQVAV